MGVKYPRRRTLVALMSTGLLQPLLAFAQQDSRVRRIGFLGSSSRESAAPFVAALEQGLRDLGYIEGKNLVIESRFASSRYENLDGLAAELVRKGVEVIVTGSAPATRAAQKATAEIPIVFVSAADPVASGFVASLARPGGNVTGVTNVYADLVMKQFELLTKTVPKMMLLAYLVNPDNLITPNALKLIEPAAQRAGIKLVVLNARTPGDIERGFLTMRRERADAAMILTDPFINQQQGKIGALAIEHRVPTIGSFSEFAEAGGLLSYGAAGGTLRRAASYVDKILKGAKPGELPVEQSSSYELVVNMKTARLLGITIPQEILVNANKVIE